MELSRGTAEGSVPEHSVTAQAGQQSRVAAPAVAVATLGAPTATAAETAVVDEKPLVNEAEQDDDSQSRSSAREEDLLAGIEEFRNQLAQLKGQGGAPATPPKIGK
jgi:hypothetical protein